MRAANNPLLKERELKGDLFVASINNRQKADKFCVNKFWMAHRRNSGGNIYIQNYFSQK
jgi:hypothetical protein